VPSLVTALAADGHGDALAGALARSTGGDPARAPGDANPTLPGPDAADISGVGR